MFKTTIINTFSSEDECEMFIMVLKQQWPKYKDSVPESTLEIVKDIDIETIPIPIQNINRNRSRTQSITKIFTSLKDSISYMFGPKSF